MAERDVTIEHYLSLNPTLYDVLDRMQIRQTALPELYQSGEPYEVEMIIELWLRILVDEYEDNRRLHLTFYGADQLKMRTGSLVNGVEITIRSIKDAQWEKLRYYVYEQEQSQMGLSFYCRGFDAVIEESQ